MRLTNVDRKVSCMTAKLCLCAICARRGKTCCQDRDIYITPGDLKRIQTAVGYADFYEFREPTDPGYFPDEEDRLWKIYVFKPDGSRRVLKRTDSGDCTFLGETGCRLTIAVRPLICRLHPYDYNAEGIYAEPASGCPVDLVEPGISLTQSIEMNPEDVPVWHHALYSEILLERPDLDAGAQY